MTNNTLRRILKQRRRHIPTLRRTIANARLTRKILQQPVFHHANFIAAYISCRGEADPSNVLLSALSQRKTCYLPVLHPYTPRCLLFAPWTPETQMNHNQYGILEPVYTIDKCIKPAFLDLVLVPLLGFDGQAHRLGMGGGYYDYTFAFRSYYQHRRKPFLLGMAFNEQYCKSFHVQPWDVTLDAVITPSRYVLGDDNIAIE